MARVRQCAVRILCTERVRRSRPNMPHIAITPTVKYRYGSVLGVTYCK